MGLQGWDDGKSESHTVMVWIGVKPRATSLHTKVGRLSSGVSARDRQIIHLDKGRGSVKKIVYLAPSHTSFLAALLEKNT
jgi:hypothetical protein